VRSQKFEVTGRSVAGGTVAWRRVASDFWLQTSNVSSVSASFAERERQLAGLMARSQQGDNRAYAELLVLVTGAVRAYVRRRVGDVPWVDDVVQETLWSLHRARATYDPRRPFGPWLYAIAGNRVVDAVRKERRIAARELTGQMEEPGRTEPASDGVEAPPDVELDAVLAALARLPPRQQEIVRAMKLGGESAAAVGERLGMTRTAVKVTAHRGYEALRRLLGVKS